MPQVYENITEITTEDDTIDHHESLYIFITLCVFLSTLFLIFISRCCHGFYYSKQDYATLDAHCLLVDELEDLNTNSSKSQSTAHHHFTHNQKNNI